MRIKRWLWALAIIAVVLLSSKIYLLDSAASPGTDGWVVVEAGVPLATTGIYAAGTPWNTTMRGIYPIAVTNPIFVNVTGGSYKPPMP